MPERHFPPPWSAEELDSCFVVKDANGQALAYTYFPCVHGTLCCERIELVSAAANGKRAEQGG